MASEFDIEKNDGDQRERGLILVAAVLLVSCAVHVGLMYMCSEYSFASGPGEMKVDHGRKWTKELPTMQVQKMSVDPLARELQVQPRPAAAPNQERQEQRVERLASSESAVVPELPASAATAPIADVLPDPAKVDAAEWKPRQQIAVVEAPVVPDELSALPRIVIPKVERVGNAADITPSFELLQSASGSPGATGNGLVVSSASMSGPAIDDAPVAVPAAAPPPPPPAPERVEGSVLGGMTTRPPTLNVVSAAEEAAAKRAADEAREAEKAAKAADRLKEEAKAEARPVPPAPQTTQVDEKVVEKEKEAVRALRDETVLQGRPFEQNVKLGLSAWVDPEHPQNKYFRLLVSSRADKPLPVISKDIVFLMDASGSIANDRLKKCRRALVKSLRMLNTGDRFNVVAFRDKFAFAFPDAAWVEVSEKTLEAAEEWLGKLTAHGQTDLFRSLSGVLAMPRDPARPVVAFVVTDGEPTAGMTRNAEIISKFAELNGGLVSVYMYGVKDTANDYLMDMLTRGSRGSWAKNAKLRWNAADGIPDLAKRFERPVLTDIAMLFSASSRAEVYPQLVSSLCADEPIAVYGVCPSTQKELVFTMRGLNGATAYESLFRVPFATAERLDKSVRTEWAQRRLYALIAAYTSSPTAELRREIHDFALKHGISVPYEKEIK